MIGKFKCLFKNSENNYEYNNLSRVGSNELIGCIGIGPSFDGIGRMLENSRKPMTQSYFLRDGSFLKDYMPTIALDALDHQESLDSKSSDQ